MREMVMTSRVRQIAAIAIGAVLLVAAVAIGAPAIGEVPTLADVDRLKLQNLALAMEVARLRAEAAQRDYDQARDAARVLLQQLERPGFTFDPSTLAYRPVPSPAPESSKP